MALGLHTPWQVKDVTFSTNDKLRSELHLRIDFVSGSRFLDEKGNLCPVHAVAVLEEAFKLYGTPEIINTDQGSQFTATIFVACVEAKGCRLSADGRGAWRDHVFIERVWRSVKYECVYTYAYDSIKDAKHSIQKYLDWCNQERPHSNLNRLTPDEAYYGLLSPLKKAAYYNDRYLLIN